MKTIFGLATPIGKSGVAVIRISGNGCADVLHKMGVTGFETRKAEYRKLKYNHEIIDEAIVVYFKSPASFTGEDVVELHVHGSKAVINKVLNILGSMPDLRMAEPGEFSRRAFENGKMDLTEAEGLADLIDAETDSQHRQAIRQMQGDLGKVYDKWRDEIINILARVEAYIDFPDEDLPKELRDEVYAEVAKFKLGISEHLNDNRRGEKIREGIYIVILGAPNVGKSSLLNYLAGRDAAIVSATAGTTRDVIEVNMELGGYAVTIADTAGLRETQDEIEGEGIKRARSRAEQADLKIIMAESGSDIDHLTNEMVDGDSILVINKIDLKPSKTAKKAHFISVKDNIGLDELMRNLQERIAKKFEINESPLITRARHREALVKALVALESFSFDKPVELMAEDLRYSARMIGRITGKIDVEDILDKIFSSFCIGK